MQTQELLDAMMEIMQGQADLIQHFLKVRAFALMIGEAEGADAGAMRTLEIAAIVHDIAIPESRRRYGDASGRHQEELGPEIARQMLQRLGLDAETTETVCYLVGHHHSYEHIDRIEYQILVEADFLVNLYEGAASREAKQHALQTIFRTKKGKALFHFQFDL